MDKAAPEEFKNDLEKTKAGLLAQLKDLEKPVEMGTDIDHFEEEADEAEEFSNRLGVIQALKERLANIETALQKIYQDRYGRCEKCGKEISPDLLKTIPESKYCRECKKE